MQSRKSKTNYYLDIAKEVSQRGTCLRRNYGAVIVKDDVIVATGYSGAPRGRRNCCDLGTCVRQNLGIPRGERYELCRSVHAEANALLQCSRNDAQHAVLYLYGADPEGNVVEKSEPCSMCKRLIINAGINRVVVREPNNEFSVYNVDKWVSEEDVLEGKLGY